MRKRIVIVAIPLMAFAVGALFVPVIQVRRDWAFKCENTGSEHGYTVWLGFVRTAEWKRTSALEAFIRQRCPTEFTNRWVSYAGTGRNLSGQAILYGHGRPALVGLKIETLDEYTHGLSDEEKRALYDFFRGATREEAKARAKEIWEAVLSKLETR